MMCTARISKAGETLLEAGTYPNTHILLFRFDALWLLGSFFPLRLLAMPHGGLAFLAPERLRLNAMFYLYLVVLFVTGALIAGTLAGWARRGTGWSIPNTRGFWWFCAIRFFLVLFIFGTLFAGHLYFPEIHATAFALALIVYPLVVCAHLCSFHFGSHRVPQ